jgi:hypothetical protein
LSRWAELIRLGFDSYEEYLNSEHWRDVRRRFHESGRIFVCICGEPANHLHHETYERIGREELDDLVPPERIAGMTLAQRIRCVEVARSRDPEVRKAVRQAWRIMEARVLRMEGAAHEPTGKDDRRPGDEGLGALLWAMVIAACVLIAAWGE